MRFQSLKEVEAHAKSLLETEFHVIVHGKEHLFLPTEDIGCRFDWCRGKKRFGVYMEKGSKKYVKLSKLICEANLDKGDKINDTILHEIAHAISEHINKIYKDPRFRGHRSGWRSVASQIGAEPTRCYDPVKEGLKMPKGKYTLRCNTCGTETEAHRRPKRKKACRQCCKKYNGGRFTKDYELELVENH